VFADAGVSPYGAAIIAGVAAVIGGVLTAGSNLAVEALRRRQQRETQRERDQRELRQATRLVLAELLEIALTIRETAKSRLTWGSDHPLPAFAWREYRAILAAYLPISAWRWVEAAYQDANGLNWHVMEMQREFKTDGPVHFIEHEWLRQPFAACHLAISELEQALDEPSGIYGYSGYASPEELEEEIWGAATRRVLRARRVAAARSRSRAEPVEQGVLVLA
jgi:hypothetical protein